MKYFLEAEADDGTGGPAGASALDGGDPPAGGSPTEPVAPAADPGKGKPAGGGGGTPAPDPVEPEFSSDSWREYLAGGDEKTLARLQRFNNPRDILKQNREFERKLSSGELRLAPKANATEEEMAQWRSEMGVPEKFTDYKITIGDDEVKLDSDNEPVFQPLLKAAHELNLSQDQFDKLIAADAARRGAISEARLQQDRAFAAEVKEQLTKDWGADFEANKNMIRTSLDRAGEGLYDLLIQGRLADGTPIGSHPGILNWIVANEREINPAAPILPGSSSVTINTVNDELTKLKALMGDKNSEYWKGPKAEKNQERYRQLLEAQEKLQKRA